MNDEEAKKQLAAVGTNLINGLKDPDSVIDMKQLQDSLTLLQLLKDISGGSSILDSSLEDSKKNKERLKEISLSLLEALAAAASEGNMIKTKDCLTLLKQVADLTKNTRIADIFYESDCVQLVDC
jgi:hypothetical protein